MTKKQRDKFLRALDPKTRARLIEVCRRFVEALRR